MSTASDLMSNGLIRYLSPVLMPPKRKCATAFGTAVHRFRRRIVQCVQLREFPVVLGIKLHELLSERLPSLIRLCSRHPGTRQLGMPRHLCGKRTKLDCLSDVKQEVNSISPE